MDMRCEVVTELNETELNISESSFNTHQRLNRFIYKSDIDLSVNYRYRQILKKL